MSRLLIINIIPQRHAQRFWRQDLEDSICCFVWFRGGTSVVLSNLVPFGNQQPPEPELHRNGSDKNSEWKLTAKQAM